jgi:subtilisin family serine protease
VVGDAESWPGASGNSHGVHTASTAVGRRVLNPFGLEVSGVAPAAYVMSYKVFYRAQSGQGSFNTAEGIAALEDMVRDGAQVIINSWGSYATSIGGEGDPLDMALRNAHAEGVVVVMSAGNDGQYASLHHPSTDYLVVGASHNNYGRLRLLAPLSPTVQDVPFAIHTYGAQLQLNETYTYPLTAGVLISPSNAGGCLPWPAGVFSGTAVLISTFSPH